MDLSPRLNRLLRFIFSVTPFLLLAAGLLFEWTAIRAMNGGRFVYSLDDPYIHLALADQIAQGHYGINPGETAAPSSSIVWPFLLVPLARTAFFEYAPLALNSLAAAATLFVYTQFACFALRRLPDLLARAGAAWIAVFLIPATNLMGLVYTGMEHSLQVLLCAVIVYGLARVVSGERAPAWLVGALILAPLVRYECLALALPGLGILLLARRWQAFAVGLLGMFIPLAAFSLFLNGNGLGWLPTSVLAKARFVDSAPLLERILGQVFINLSQHQGRVLAGLGLALAVYAYQRRAVTCECALALAGAAGVLVHLAIGQFGWWDRYEVYMLTSAVLLILYLSRERLALQLERGKPAVNLLALLGLSVLVSAPYYATFARTPLAAANIYEQQYQMHRFVVDYFQGPVAVNDLGWVGFRNPDYVLDLWGLANREALASRSAAESEGAAQNGPWMDRLVRQHHVDLVMIYDDWFFGFDHPPPPGWIRLARLRLGWPLTVAGGDTVTFYALDPGQAARIRALLREFKPTLPAGVRLEMVE